MRIYRISIFFSVVFLWTTTVLGQDYSLIKKAKVNIEKGNYIKAEKQLDKASKADYGFCGTADLEADIEIQELRFDLYKKTNNKVKMKMLLDSIDPFFESTKYSIERIKILLQMNSKDFLKNKIQNAFNNYDCYKISYGKTLELEINNNEILKLYIDKSKIDKLINEGYNCVEALKKFYKESEYETLLSIN
jgi:hypothetical protein